MDKHRNKDQDPKPPSPPQGMDEVEALDDEDLDEDELDDEEGEDEDLDDLP
jgi:hypothetical protein